MLHLSIQYYNDTLLVDYSIRWSSCILSHKWVLHINDLSSLCHIDKYWVILYNSHAYIQVMEYIHCMFSLAIHSHSFEKNFVTQCKSQNQYEKLTCKHPVPCINHEYNRCILLQDIMYKYIQILFQFLTDIAVRSGVFSFGFLVSS